MELRSTDWRRYAYPLLQTALLAPVCLWLISVLIPHWQTLRAAPGINRQINFQGKVVNDDGTNVPDGPYNFVFSLYDADESGIQLWTETQSLPVTDGIFRASLGAVTSLPGSVDFNTDNVYLAVNFNGDGDMEPRIRFTAVPYAFNAEKVSGLTVTDTTGTLTIPDDKTISFADAFTTSGAFPLTLTVTNTTNATLPSGTIILVDTASSQTLTNKVVGNTGLVFSGAATDITASAGEGLVITGNAASLFETTSGAITFQASTSAVTSWIQIGSGGSGSLTPDLFVLDIKSDTGDPEGTAGAMYYNEYMDAFRCFQGGSWQNCTITGGSGYTGPPARQVKPALRAQPVQLARTDNQVRPAPPVQPVQPVLQVLLGQ
ncbi:hypothetical protein A2Z33_00150 [Candidatus Gottesmanbacteria bacterium RBG_16_52_11]|uniref:Uncharacterized protein n=1 Tax=Candidatus Gottesmanbacteria bacterium RBG_16_52_11 TaxID=1798374 RepID=A0A1F5YP49_9BACT|nr:MAG: hypothetical protein A2Z33_00150 [Candidatus Gottesmanbacteria bacterium RBG_16_52_11]